MEWTTKRFALITGVSIRTLHYYDEIGLLKPFSVDEQNGYRTYNEESFSLMQQILFYREMGFSLESIREVISVSGEERSVLLSERKRALLQEKERLERLAGLLERVEQGQDLGRLVSSFDRKTAELDERTTAFYELLDEADRLLKNDTVHGQLVVVKTKKGNIYHMFNGSPGQYEPMQDIAFMDMLLERDDVQVRYIAALWNPHVCELLHSDIPYALEVPGWCLRRGLLDLAPGNEDALVFLLGEGVCNAKTLGGIQPPWKGQDAEMEKIRRLRGKNK